MLRINYKIKGIALEELWFAPKKQLEKQNLFSFTCYRDSHIGLKKIGMYQELKYTLINSLSLEEDKLFSHFKSNVRNEIRKAEKIEGFRYEIDAKSKEQFLTFYRIFATAKSLPIIESKSIDKYGENMFYISGYLEEKLTNMQVYIVDKEDKLVRLLHSISTLHEAESSAVRAKIGWINRFLHWRMMRYFKAEGFTLFDWGGYNNGVDAGLAGIDKFKASFGGEKISLFNYYTYPYMLLKILKEKLL